MASGDSSPYGRQRGVRTAVVHINFDDLHQYAQGSLGRFRVFVIETHLHGCPLCSARLSELIKLLAPARLAKPAAPLPTVSFKDRRREARIPTDDPAVLQVISPFSSERIAVRVIDVSKSGLQLRLDAPVDPGSTVKVRLKETILFAEIRHCRQISADEYRAGLVLQEIISGHEVVRTTTAGS